MGRRTNDGRRMPVLYLCFALSGACGLIYEVVWARMLGLSFGHTTYATTTVLAAFMTGLALGSRFLGPSADRVERPLLLYAGLEAATGVYCALAPWLLALARGAYLGVHDALLGSPGTRVLVQFLLAFSVLVFPSALMGATLPAMTRGLSGRGESLAGKVGFVYGLNTAGAALGAFLAGYLLLPMLGLKTTNCLAVAGNLAVGGLTWWLFRARPKTEAEEAGVRSGALQAEAARPPFEGLLLVGFGVSGSAAMLYQIVWTRALILVIGSSVYSFSAVLVTVLTGIATGSLLFRRLRWRADATGFAALQFYLAGAAFLMVPLFRFLPELFLFLFQSYRGSYAYVQVIQFLIVASVALVPTTLGGMTFPCLMSALGAGPGRTGGRVGRAYAYNSVGAVLGTVVAGFWLVPTLGTYRSLMAGVCANLFVGTVVLCVARPRARTRVLGVALAGLILLFLPSWWDQRMMAAGVSIYAGDYGAANGFRTYMATRFGELLSFEEGIDATVSVVKGRDGGKALAVNGKTDASNRRDMDTQVKLATIPMLLHRDPRRVAIIGLGSGVTAGIATLFAEPAAIDVIELEPAVLRASRYFSPENQNFERDRRIRVHIDDGRSFLEAAKRSYDVIISEPSNPWIAGVADLFSEEFFQRAQRKLAPGGVFCQWLQGYNITPDELRMVVRTFQRVFGDATLWAAMGTDFILIGRAPGGGAVDAHTVDRHLLRSPRLAAYLEAEGSSAAVDLFADFRLGPDELRHYAGTGRLNTEDLPALQFAAPKSLYLAADTVIETDIQAHRSRVAPPFVHDDALATPRFTLALAEHLMRRDRSAEALAYFPLLPALAPNPVPVLNGTGFDLADSSVPVVGRLETFDGPPQIHFFPRMGASRPDEGDGKGFLHWVAAMGYFMRIAGLEPRVGRGGSRGLTVRGVPGVRSVAYFAPMAVKPSTRYEVDVWMKGDVGDDVEWGAGALEYDSLVLREDQLSGSEDRAHLVCAHRNPGLRGPNDWQERSLGFETSARTRMVHLLLYRDGPPDTGSVVFDDVAVREVR